MASISDPRRDRQADDLLEARLQDAVELSIRRSCPRYVGFLDERQQAVARAVLHSCRCENYLFFGGYAAAERTLAGVFPSCMDADPAYFPLTSIGFAYRAGTGLTHRDFLGTLLSCGIKRETIGDILLDDAAGRAVVFAEETIVSFLLDQVTKVKGEGVSLQSPWTGELPAARQYREITGTVASPRLDAVLKALLGSSREEAARQITAGLVSLDHVPTTAVAAAVQEGAVLSVRGAGRFIVDEIGPPTRKGRLFLKARRCI